MKESSPTIDVYKITYKNKSWTLPSARYYSAQSVDEAVEDFLYCYCKKRLGEKRVTLRKIRRWNRYSGKWDDMTRDGVDHINNITEELEDIHINIFSDDTVSLRRK